MIPYICLKRILKGLDFKTGSVDEAINEAKRLSADGLRAAHQISASLLNSSNQRARREANLIYAITNLAMHLNDNRDPVRTLTRLLDKLNVTSTGRDLFDPMAKVESGQSGEILLNDFQGLSELQSYFADTPKVVYVLLLIDRCRPYSLLRIQYPPIHRLMKSS